MTENMKVERAKEIAELLNDPGKWHSHGRAIDMKTLRGEEIKLEIEDFEHDSARLLHKLLCIGARNVSVQGVFRTLTGSAQVHSQ